MKFAAVTSYYNPCRYVSRQNNFATFKTHLDKQGVPLYVGEIAFFNEPFMLNPKAMNVCQYRTNTICWQKEAILNAVINQLPPEIEYVAWLDCDVVFNNNNWVAESMRALDAGFNLVQPFEYVIRLPKLAGDTPSGEGKQSKGIIHGINSHGYASHDAPIQQIYGDSGFAWVIKRNLIKDIGLYDACIVGGGDLAIIHAAVGDFLGCKCFQNDPQFQHYYRWAFEFFQRVQRKVACVPGSIMHLYHGQSKNRHYDRRYSILEDFDPNVNIYKKDVYEWTDSLSNFNLRRNLAEYFRIRDEDT